ncbi:hypothetical protein HD806DRAFT_525170 [Xylariaceae sp. AK1471]|nr:hypothetical protein HD806DRAFT_525170 [Xylariaceae sp. AK1471]
MSDDQSSWLFNQRFNEKRDFPQFSLLPWELRDQVWKSALQRRRLIRVTLKQRQPDDITDQESRDTRYGGSSLFINGFQLLSKLLRVNSEARNAALAFYRVRLPCVLMRPGLKDSHTRVGVLLFNPEHDVLWFEHMDHPTHLTDFVSTILMYDSRRIGLCNMAFSLCNIRGTLEADDPDKYKCPTFIETISNIREFYLITETNSYYLDSAKERYNDQASHNVPAPAVQPFHHRTPIAQKLSPLMSSIPTFDLLHRDPRPIAQDLSRLFLGFDDIPQEISDWKLLLREWGVDPSHVESRVLFMYRDLNPCFPVEGSSHEDLDLQRFDMSTTNPLLYKSSSSLVPDIHLTVEGQEMEREDSLAFGFWLFPLDAFSETTKLRHPTQSVHVWDLSSYWPELGLVHLPAGSSSNEGDRIGVREVTRS